LRGEAFDVAYTSTLCRAYDSLSIILAELGQTPPVIRDPALNERHYGDLQGLDKAQVAQRVGAEQVQRWRRSFDVAPPGGESLEATARRTVPFFERAIGGDLHRGRNVLVVAHGNSLRVVVMKLDAISHDEVVDVELETGVPIAYELTTDGTVVKKTVLR
jgi:2,3-bisphosphoglycerate-dependent phosphoglycerate mutase